MMQRDLVAAALLMSIGVAAGAGVLAARSGDGAAVASPADGSHKAEQQPPGARRGESTAQSAKDLHGSIQSIRGIEGIDSITLQNLEAVLRMQARPIREPRSTARTAAALTTKDAAQEEQQEEMPDARVEYLDFEMEGS